MLARHRAHGFGIERQPSAHRRRRHRLGHGRRPQGVRVQPGLHDLRRRARRGVRREDPQGDGPRRVDRRAARRPQRRRRRAHPRRRRVARGVRRHLLPQREVVGRHPADLGRARSVRRRRGVLARDDRLHLHGEGRVEHVHHRSRRREDRDRRRGHARGARRRDHARDEVGCRERSSPTTSRGASSRCATCCRSCRRTTSRTRRTSSPTDAERSALRRADRADPRLARTVRTT